MTQTITSTDVARTLAQLGRDLDNAVEAIKDADYDATLKRAAYDLAYSKAFVSAQGSMDLRKHLALIETHELRLSADVAEVLVRHLKRRIDAISKRIEVGRSIGTSVRAELSLAGSRDML